MTSAIIDEPLASTLTTADFRQAVANSRRYATTVAGRVGGWRHADDAVQEAMCGLLALADRPRPQLPVRALVSSATRFAAVRIRRRPRAVPVTFGTGGIPEPVAPPTEVIPLPAAVEAAVLALPPEQYESVALELTGGPHTGETRLHLAGALDSLRRSLGVTPADPIPSTLRAVASELGVR